LVNGDGKGVPLPAPAYIKGSRPRRKKRRKVGDQKRRGAGEGGLRGFAYHACAGRPIEYKIGKKDAAVRGSGGVIAKIISERVGEGGTAGTPQGGDCEKKYALLKGTGTLLKIRRRPISSPSREAWARRRRSSETGRNQGDCEGISCDYRRENG